MSTEGYVTKGTRIRARWFQAYPTALGGMQMKFGATPREVVGTVTHVRGDHPTAPTKVEFIVQPDEGGEEIKVQSAWVVEIVDAAKDPGVDNPQ